MSSQENRSPETLLQSKRVPLKDSSRRFTNLNKAQDLEHRKSIVTIKAQNTAPVTDVTSLKSIKKPQQSQPEPQQAVSGGHLRHQRHPASTRLTGNQLRQWQQSWRRIMKVSVVYFEENTRRHERENIRATAAFKNLGARIAKFFSDSVTIIVSMRPYNKRGEYPQGDIFRVARKKELKVWNYEKVFRFMHHLGEPVPDTQPESKLSSLLKNEKLFGPNDRDPNAKRDDMKYFTNLYIYAYDLRQQTRPVAIREWSRNHDYPKLCKSTNGRSLFVHDSHPKSESSALKRHTRRVVYLAEVAEYRQNLIEASYVGSSEKCPTPDQRAAYRTSWEREYYHGGVETEMESEAVSDDDTANSKREVSRETFDKQAFIKKEPKNTENLLDYKPKAGSHTSKERKFKVTADHELPALPEKSVLADTEMGRIPVLAPPDAHGEIGQKDANRQLLEIERSRMVDNEASGSLPALLHREDSLMTLSGSKFKNEYGEIQASGVQNQSCSTAISGNNIGNGLAPSYSLVYNKKIANDKKKTISFNRSKRDNVKINDSMPLNGGKVSALDKENVVPKTNADQLETRVRIVRKHAAGGQTLEAVTKRRKMVELDKIAEQKATEFVLEKKKLEKETSAEPRELCTAFKHAEETGLKLKRKREMQKAERIKKAKHDSKPGYCENCRVKYADFGEHIQTDKHRQFALNPANFREIDDLINTVNLTRRMGL